MGVAERAGAKKASIQQAESVFKSGYLIYHPPNPALLFEDDELLYFAKKIEGQVIPSQFAQVQKSHSVKKKIIACSGRCPNGFRTKEVGVTSPNS